MRQEKYDDHYDDDDRGSQTPLGYGVTVLFAALLVTMSMTAMTGYVTDKTADAEKGQAQVVGDRTASKLMSADHLARQAPNSAIVLELGLTNNVQNGNLQIRLRDGGDPHLLVVTPGNSVEQRVDLVVTTPITETTVTINEPIYAVYDPVSNTLTLKEEDEL